MNRRFQASWAASDGIRDSISGSRFDRRYNRDSRQSRYADTLNVARGVPTGTNSVAMHSKLGALTLNGTDVQLQSLNGSVRSHNYGRGYTTDNIHRDYKRGDIIRVPWNAPCLNDRSEFDGSEATFSSITGPICSKLRPMIIIQKFNTHAVAVPIFSHGGRGPPQGKAQFGSLPLVDESKVRDRDEVKGKLVSRGWDVADNSVVYLCKPCAIEWAFPIKICGELTERSLRAITHTFKTFLSIGNMSVREQDKAFEDVLRQPLPSSSSVATLVRQKDNTSVSHRQLDSGKRTISPSSENRSMPPPSRGPMSYSCVARQNMGIVELSRPF